ncbi:MAG: EscF/YscF/HrpA family type III secretion system needle major subunit [Arsenophonus endosymbiont of Dermacentor nuttalli]
MSIDASSVGHILGETKATSDEYQKNIRDAIEKLKVDHSNSADLAEFRAAMAAHSIMLNFQSTTIKTFKDNVMTILGNMC